MVISLACGVAPPGGDVLAVVLNGAAYLKCKTPNEDI